MGRMNISLPEAMQQFVEEQVQRGGYASASDYVQALIQEAQVRAARHDLDAKLLEGLDSGPATPMTRDDWDDLKRRVWARDKDSIGNGTHLP
jgi:antitoxin ParD1/3/4